MESRYFASLSPLSLLTVPPLSTTTHPPRSEMGFTPNSAPSTPLLLPCFWPPARLDVCSHFSCLPVFTHAACVHTSLRAATEENFPNTTNWDPALYTCKAIPTAPGRYNLVAVGMGLKPDFLGQIPPCQLYVSMMGKFVTKVPQHLDLKIRGKMMPIL